MFISLPSQSNPIQDVYHRLNQLQERVQNVYHRSDQFQPVWNVRGEFPLGAHPATPPFTATINLEATTDHLSILSRTPLLCNTIHFFTKVSRAHPCCHPTHWAEHLFAMLKKHLRAGSVRLRPFCGKQLPCTHPCCSPLKKLIHSQTMRTNLGLLKCPG